jgi:hypothetical protein
VPVILPTPDELSAMDWHKRDKVIRKARTLLAEYAAAYVEAMPRWYRMTEEQREASAAARALNDEAWAEREREAAEALYAAMPADPQASEHRAAVMS